MALLPPQYLNAVVAIGVGDDQKSRQWVGTGFIYGNFIKDVPETNQKQYSIWLITNKHVLEDFNSIYIKFNSAQNQKSKDYKVLLLARNGRKKWVGHPNDLIDVATIYLNPNVLKTEGILYDSFRSDITMNKKMMTSNGITEGDRVFVLGFPMGLVTPDRQYVICRGGYIARVRDFLEDRTNEFLIDATVFPGNSGGPVIFCPSGIFIKGTKSNLQADLIGIVKSYVPYRDYAISAQTKQARIIFEENSGLAAVESIDSIIETVQLAEKRLNKRIAQARYRQKKDQN